MLAAQVVNYEHFRLVVSVILQSIQFLHLIVIHFHPTKFLIIQYFEEPFLLDHWEAYANFIDSVEPFKVFEDRSYGANGHQDVLNFLLLLVQEELHQ
jgi:hypothetical protein